MSTSTEAIDLPSSHSNIQLGSSSSDVEPRLTIPGAWIALLDMAASCMCFRIAVWHYLLHPIQLPHMNRRLHRRGAGLAGIQGYNGCAMM